MHTFLLFALATGIGGADERLYEGTGPHVRSVKTSNAEAQRYFDQGLNFLYAFNQNEAERSFRAAARRDPDCAMAWWGVAMANGPHYNNMTIPPEDEAEAVQALAQARRVMSDEPAADQALVRAASKRFATGGADRAKLEAAYSAELGRAYATHPKDSDLGALYAESMMNLRPWDLWTPAGKPQPGTLKIVSTLERVLAGDGDHPLALHLLIHAVEASDRPERAIPAADRLRDLQPGLGHNVHMPSHIDVRVGQWEKAIVSNEKAIAADDAYYRTRPEQGFYWLYMTHNRHMLGFAAMMVGRKALAVQATDDMVAVIPPDVRKANASWMDGWFVMPVEVRVRFGMWNDVLAYPAIDAQFPLSRALQHAARAMAHAAKGQPEQARAEQAQFYASRRNVPGEALFGGNRSWNILRVATHHMNGEVSVAEGMTDRAVAHLRAAVEAEDALNYMEPPDWIQPSRHTLGALLVREARFAEAAEVYEQDLKKLPNNGWSLFGLALCREKLGQAEEAAALRARFEKSWAMDEAPITSSCLCIPGKD